MNTSKSFRKRIRITKNGKAVRRPMGIGHNHSRKSGKRLQASRKTMALHYPVN